MQAQEPKESLWEGGRKEDIKRKGKEVEERGIISPETPRNFVLKEKKKFLVFWINLMENSISW